jgi:hypothetical protein
VHPLPATHCPALLPACPPLSPVPPACRAPACHDLSLESMLPMLSPLYHFAQTHTPDSPDSLASGCDGMVSHACCSWGWPACEHDGSLQNVGAALLLPAMSGL